MDDQTVERIYELSPLQEGILFHAQHSPGSGMYFEQFSFALRGPVNEPAGRCWVLCHEFAWAWHPATASHYLTRLRRVACNPQPRQVIVANQVLGLDLGLL